MPRKDILKLYDNLKSNKKPDGVLSCTLSGRVVHVSSALKSKLGMELAGRNLNDFIDDKTVSEIIASASNGEGYGFSCFIMGRWYYAFSEKESGVISVSLYEAEENDGAFAGEDTLKYLQSQINSGLSDILAALRVIENSDKHLAMHARQNIYKLLRVTRNVFDTLSCSRGDVAIEKKNCEVLSLCNNAIERIRFPISALNVELEIMHDGGWHVVNCVAEHIERILFGLVAVILKKQQVSNEPCKIKIEIFGKDDDIIISVLSDTRIISDELFDGVFRKSTANWYSRETDTVQSMAAIKAMAEYNGGSFMMVSEKDYDRISVVFKESDVTDAPIVKSPEAAYCSGIDDILVELAEVLPDVMF